MRLTLWKQSQKNHAFTNMVYVDQATYEKLGCPRKVLLQGQLVHLLGVDTNLGEGRISTNKVHREAMSLSPNDVGNYDLKVEHWKPDTSINDNIVLMKVCVDTFHTREVKLDAEELEELIRDQWNEETFCPGQQFVIKFTSRNFIRPGEKMIYLRVLIEACKVSDPTGKTGLKEVKYGVLSRSVDIMIVKPPDRKYIKLKEQQGTQNVIDIESWSGEALGIGGLDEEFTEIFRQAFASRLCPNDVLKKLDLTHVRGMLLYGPPGTGKTLIARKIASILKAREPKIVKGPEIFNKYVGEAERKVRELFEDAEQDQKENGEEADLHMVIFDEIDAICKSRGSMSGASSVHDNVVNQLLSIIDGVDELNNILVVGMTNRKDLIDEALLRPGRMGVQIEIGLPDEEGRQQIFRIHTKSMRDNKMITKDVDLNALAAQTKNYSGAEIKGVITRASNFALNRQINMNDLGNLDRRKLREVMVQNEDFQKAIASLKPAFGVVEEDLLLGVEKGIVRHSDLFSNFYDHSLGTMLKMRDAMNVPNRFSLLLYGSVGCGKTALATSLSCDSKYPFVKRVAADSLVGFSDVAVVAKISKTFDDAYKSKRSIVILDDLERICAFERVGPRFSNTILQAIKQLVRRKPPDPQRRIFIIATCTQPILHALALRDYFDAVKRVPNVAGGESLGRIIQSLGLNCNPQVLQNIQEVFKTSLPVKRLIALLGFCCDDDGQVTLQAFEKEYTGMDDDFVLEL